ncbi:MAG TPA: hypothetical protein VK348_11215 [Planctomycetota bacterium]|nr:hypothetical protein [Planctomycetota bacterium]
MRSTVLCLAALCGVTAAQSQLVQITVAARPHFDAGMEPGGLFVAYLSGPTGQQNLGVVDLTTHADQLIYTSTTNDLQQFQWHPAGTSLFFVEGQNIRSVARNGSSPLTIAANQPGSSLRIWCTILHPGNPSSDYVIGSRVDSGSTGVLFKAPANGQGQRVDLTTLPGVIDEVRVDSGNRFLLLRNTAGVPNAPIGYYWLDLQATIPQAIGNPIANNPQGGYWLDAGQNFVYSRLLSGLPQLFTMDLSGNETQLTAAAGLSLFHRRSFVAVGGSWIACELRSPDALGIAVGIMPLDGGGLVQIGRGQQLQFNPGRTASGLSIDQAGTTVAVGAASAPGADPQIYVGSLQREIVVHPRLQVGGTFHIEVTAAAGELAAVAAGLAFASVPFNLAGLQGSFWLDPVVGVATVLTGVGGGTGPIIASYSIPNVPALVGVQLLYQGVRLDQSFNGAFTNYGYYQVF